MICVNTPKLRNNFLKLKQYHFCGGFVWRFTVWNSKKQAYVSPRRDITSNNFNFPLVKLKTETTREIKLKNQQHKSHQKMKHERAQKDQNVMQQTGRWDPSQTINLMLMRRRQREKVHLKRWKGRNLPALASEAEIVMENSWEWHDNKKKF